ncbi:LacI family DNA-binding transcriptional regulator [Paraferrimonas sedimenticola]|uniref:LacI family transcriptional regulator n=1 Tax=Paraferrimonas sedimenticola TaxID=375674 RepID=A0AA37W133_9GAMM|nr:LacI family DNA-binding transcriptional regulator [Paraferrimonas sedimenticola]GLP95847.1 LacI family transcriptional regulator [Paraferrimonas sedimenticola]
MKGKATSFDIAHLAGVSQSTVSRALRNSPLVKQETIDKVKRIARELNYTVDKNASSLRSQQSQTLALLLFEDPTSDDSNINPFFFSMLASITQACAHEGYDLLVSFQQLSNDFHADYEDSHKADGIILLGYGDDIEYKPKLEALQSQGTRFVRWGPQSQAGLSVSCDNRQGGAQATKHLIDKGHQRIAFVGDASNHYPEFFARYQGYVSALMAHDLPVEPALQHNAITTEEAGYEATKQLLNQGDSFTALFAASDLIAVGALKAIAEKGLKVPQDIAVVGFDDIPVASYTSPPLTTVRQNTKLAGEVLVKSLIAQIRGEEVESTTIATAIVERGSSG